MRQGPSEAGSIPKNKQERWGILMNLRYITIGQHKDVCGGAWGAGKTIEESRRNFRKAGGSGKTGASKTFSFESGLPFAPANREATETEADCYIDGAGAVCWIRCTRTEIV